MVRPTKAGPTRPLLSPGALDEGGGTLVGAVDSGLVPTSTGSNTWLWLENVRRVTANGSNTILGPFVNVAAGSNVILSVDQFPASTPSNTLRIHSTAGGGGSLTVEEDGDSPISPVDHIVFAATGDASVGVTDDGGGQVTVTIDATAGATTPGTVLLEQHTASASATLDFTTAFTSTHDEYLIELLNILPASNNVALRAALSSDGGSSYNSSSNYFSARTGIYNDGTEVNANDGNPTTFWVLGTGLNSTSSRGISASLRLITPLSTTSDKTLYGTFSLTNQSNLFGGVLSCMLTVAGTAFDAMRFVMSSGNIASGTIRVYGIVK